MNNEEETVFQELREKQYQKEGLLTLREPMFQMHEMIKEIKKDIQEIKQTLKEKKI